MTDNSNSDEANSTSNENYFIRGSIIVQFEKDELTVLMTPSAGFLSPDKSYAVAYPDPYIDSSGVPKEAKLIKIIDQRIECKVQNKNEWSAALVAVATHHLPIELQLKKKKNSLWTIVGFKFPLHS